MAGEVARLPRRIRLRVFFRTLLLQATWNRRGMQNLGMAFALLPAFEYLYPDEHARTSAMARHLGFFNSHPYLGSAIVGGTLHHEERVAAGQTRPEAVDAFKQALMGPFAAVGDSFFWLSLRPFAGLFAAVLAPFIGLWAVALFLFLYDVPHLLLRARLFSLGYRKGDRVVESVARIGLPALGARLRGASAFFAGGAVVVSLSLIEKEGAPPLPAAAALVLSFAGAFALFGRAGAITAGGLALLVGLLLAFFI